MTLRAQLTHDLFTVAKFLLLLACVWKPLSSDTK